jgi:hypothetical protein
VHGTIKPKRIYGTDCVEYTYDLIRRPLKPGTSGTIPTTSAPQRASTAARMTTTPDGSLDIAGAVRRFSHLRKSKTAERQSAFTKVFLLTLYSSGRRG